MGILEVVLVFDMPGEWAWREYADKKAMWILIGSYVNGGEDRRLIDTSPSRHYMRL